MALLDLSGFDILGVKKKWERASTARKGKLEKTACENQAIVNVSSIMIDRRHCGTPVGFDWWDGVL